MSEELETLREQLLQGFSEALGTHDDSALATYLESGKPPPSEACELLAWDANSVHSFVFDTTNATAIRGASHLLAELDKELANGKILGIKKQQILFAGGGSGLAVVRKDQVAEVTTKLHRLFCEKTKVATCCVATTELGGRDVPFNELYLETRSALESARLRLSPDAEVAVPFFAMRCDVCGRRAAAAEEKRLGGSRLECSVCSHAIEYGKSDRHEGDEIPDFEELADAEGFLAVVYLDGNGIGARISELTSPLAFAAFSRAIDRTLRGLFETLAKDYGLREAGEDPRGLKRHAYQLPICGGDDLVAILPGDLAIPFTRDLLQRFEEAADADPDLRPAVTPKHKLPPIGAAAGVALGKARFPIRHLLHEAEDLLKSAKGRVYRDGVRSALDFAEVADGSPRRESEQAPRLWKEKPELLESGRPYALGELKELGRRLRTVRAAQPELGRSQLYTLRRYARSGLNQLRNHVLYQVGRHKEWCDLAGELAGDPQVIYDKEEVMKQFAPTYSGQKVFDFADMVELYDHWREPTEARS